MTRLAPGGREALDQLLHESIAEGTVPNIFFAATNATETIYENQVGSTVLESGPVTPETTLEIYSMTKFIVSLATLQLVEKKVLDLDDQDIVYRVLPELGSQKVLTGSDELVPQTSRITIRMLLNHTAGCSTPQRNPLLAKWYAKQEPSPRGVQAGASVRSLISPLLHQPGSTWMYSSGTDWLGVLIHRVTGLSLEEYFRQNIFNRVDGGMPDTTFYPRDDIVKRKAAIYRADNGLTRLPLFADDRADTVSKVTFQAGSGGLYGTTRDFLALCRAVLRGDILKSSDLLFAPSLTPEQARGAVAYYTWEERWSPPPSVDNMNYSLGLALNLHDSDHGRKAGSGGWYGMARTHYWIDPASGLAGVCNTQVIGPEPTPWNKIFNAFERTLYDHLE